MTNGGLYLAAIGLIIGAFLILMYLFQERNWLLKYLFILGIFVATLFIPTAVYNIPIDCDIVPVNITTTTSTLTQVTYSQQCFTSTENIPDTFYIVFWSIYLILFIYFIIKLLFELYQHFKQVASSMRFWRGGQR